MSRLHVYFGYVYKSNINIGTAAEPHLLRHNPVMRNVALRFFPEFACESKLKFI